MSAPCTTVWPIGFMAATHGFSSPGPLHPRHSPNGPPVPMLMAAEIGFSSATFGAIRLPPMRMASIASGVPWPRIFAEPKRAISPMTRPPHIGAASTSHHGWCRPGATSEVATRWYNTRLVTKPISRSNSHAANTPQPPTSTAQPVICSIRGPTVKSPRRFGRPALTAAPAPACPRGRSCPPRGAARAVRPRSRRAPRATVGPGPARTRLPARAKPPPPRGGRGRTAPA